MKFGAVVFDSDEPAGSSSQKQPRFAAVVFDVDGVLAQSMENHYEAYRVAFAEHGIAISRADVFEREGKSTPEVIASIAKERGIPLSPERHKTMSEKKQNVFFAFGPAPLYPGAREILDHLKKVGLKVALASGTYRRNVENHLGPLIERFDATVTSNDVTHTKPHPEPYLKACEKLGVAPAATLVIENAPLGIQSAKAAGATVWAVTTTLPVPRLQQAGADRVFPSLLELGEALMKEVRP